MIPGRLIIVVSLAMSALAGAQVAESTPTTLNTPPAAITTAAEHAPEPVIPAAESDDQVKLAFAPYIWLTGFSGSTSVRGIEMDVSESFVDILNTSDKVFGLMGAIDLQYKRLVAQVNAAWTTAEMSEARGVFRNGSVDANLTLNSTWIEFLGGYRFLDKPMNADSPSRRRFTLDGFVGGRVTYVGLDAEFSASTTITLPDGVVLTPSASSSRSESEQWIEPFVGTRVGIDLGENWALQLRGDIGGFGLSGAQFSWQALGIVGYRWHLDGWDIAAFGGFRALGQDYSNDEFGWDVITYGPILGAEFAFAF